MSGRVRACALLSMTVAGCAASGGGGFETQGEVPVTVDPSAPAPNTKPQVVFYPRVGSMMDDPWGSLGPGVVLMNAGLAPKSAFTWIHDTVDKPRVAGDVVALCTRGGDVYSDALLTAAPFNSVQTVLVPPASTADEVALVANRLATAHVVFLGDGAASEYAAWSSGPIGAAVRRVYERGGVIAGAGAGAAALGSMVRTGDATSAMALANPFDARLALAPGPFALPLLAGTSVETELQSRDRFGLLAAITARVIADGAAAAAGVEPMGIGLEGGAALAFDRLGSVTLLDDDGGSASAWLVRGDAVDRVVAGQPLAWKTASVTRFDAPGESLTFYLGCGTAFAYGVAIDGAAAAPFTPADPYDAMGAASPCAP
jgi:cyanophycinase-like exopeptidase